MRITLLGSRGMLGAALAAHAPGGMDVRPYGRDDVDITDAEAVRAIITRDRPVWVLNAAAFTAVDAAELDPGRAFAVNGDAVGTLAEICEQSGAAVVHVSTDQVFPGTSGRPYREDDETDPVNTYGASKLAGERALAASGARSLILRTEWLFGAQGPSFPRKMRERAVARQATRVVDDQVGVPTSAVDLARAIWTLVERDVTGLYHIANSGDPVSKFEYARAVFAERGVPELITSCKTSEFPAPAPRPAHSVLDTDKLRRETGVVLRPWPEALAELLREVADRTG